MPPRIRTRGAKALKENVDVENQLQRPSKVTKTVRKVLGDKTNSLSDEDVIEEKKVPSTLSLAVESKARPRRQRRLPTRFKENPVLNNLSTSQNNSTTQQSAEVARKVSQNENSIEIIQIDPPEPLKKQGRRIKNKNDKENIEITKPSQTKLKNAIVVIEKSANLKPYQTKRKPLTNANAKVPLTLKKIVASTKSKILQPKKHDVKNNAESPEMIASQSKNSDSSMVKNSETDISRNSSIIQTSRNLTFTPPSRKTSSPSERLVKKRPKRIHRLPSRFDDHSMSPNKFISMQPCHASTPLNKKNQPSNNNPTTLNKSKDNSFKSPKSYLLKKTSPDTNNNPRRIRSVRLKAKTKASTIKTTPVNTKPGKRLIDKSLSFKILDSKKSKDMVDVYEFTYDPNEEPPPQKKKKKRVIRKKPPKPKTVVFKNNYDNNLSKAIAALKTVVSKKVPSENPDNSKPQQAPIKTVVEQTIIESNQPVQGQNENKVDENNKDIQTKNAVKNMQLQAKPQNLNPTTNVLKPHTSNKNKAINVVTNDETNVNKSTVNEIGTKSIISKSVCENAPSIRVEDIAADFDISYHDDINYSPVNSPRPLTPNPTSVTHNEDFRRETIQRAIHNKDPLNLQEGTSFFDDQPVASSSMNMSVRHPLASPWRVEFGSLPIKWQANTYLKPNMTPAVESSFISSEDSNKKKHVYVNMIPQSNDSLPQIVENNAPNLKQASIISFMREVAERNAKKKRGKSASPMKANTLFEDITNKTNANIAVKSTKSTSKKVVSENSNENISKSSSDTSNDKENVRLTRKRKNENIVTKLPAKSPRKERDTNVTYFGFDDSENQDQENIPCKNVDKNRVRALRSRSRVLQEFNGQNGPARAALPLAAKTKIAESSEAVQRMFDELKSGEDAPQLLNEDTQQNAGNTNVETVKNVDINDDEEGSVHLFEDIDFVHHLKPMRKSYGKAKKVTFRQRSMSDSDTNASDAGNVSPSTSYEDDLADLNFTLPKVSEKKKVNKKKSKKVRSKKEEKEANEWAAGFNSMCEDIEDFPLLVE